MTEWSANFIAVDWGTTNRRAYLLDTSGVTIDQFEDHLGVTSVPPGGFEQAIHQISERLGDRPMLLAGMIGSNRGWREAPYLPCPAGIGELAGQLVWVADKRIAIVPGLSVVQGRRGDVMRGEEVQLFGLVRLDGVRGDATVCHPGTHTKWARLDGGRVTDFRTAMTGELFSLLGEHSILASMLQHPVETDEHFLEGVEATFAGAALTAELFSVRARVLLSLLDERAAASYTSGLLIGCDLRAGLALAAELKDEVIVLGRPALTRLFAAALARLGIPAREVDGAGAFAAGMDAIRHVIRKTLV